ncbi:hypothetical protein GCM10023082_32020 [Streptomyces tremellae]|uniref:Uncharacterized protein n=1 Tax=Streptomyces tremellae TaxID=1124239 RepID=A0ABP7F5T6_9ACTN
MVPVAQGQADGGLRHVTFLSVAALTAKAAGVRRGRPVPYGVRAAGRDGTICSASGQNKTVFVHVQRLPGL